MDMYLVDDMIACIGTSQTQNDAVHRSSLLIYVLYSSSIAHTANTHIRERGGAYNIIA